MNLAADCGWWVPYENFCILQEKTKEVHLKDNRIHNETGPAIAYSDGFELYGLNGVRVPKEIVMTPANDLDPAMILKETNAEVRREIVRKIGIHNIVEKLGGEVVDKKGHYELLLLDLQDGRKRPYLKMKNPSIDTWHVEGVPTEIKTVNEALAWRNGLTLFTNPEILT